MDDLGQVRDPDHALAISTAGLAHQHAHEWRVMYLVHALDQLRAENHLAARLENLLGARR